MVSLKKRHTSFKTSIASPTAKSSVLRECSLCPKLLDRIADNWRTTGCGPVLICDKVNRMENPAAHFKRSSATLEVPSTGPSPESSKRVFISYSHDSVHHEQRVRSLVEQLRKEGIDAWFDQFENPPQEGWPRWMQRQIMGANFVLLVCSETYRRRFEGEGSGLSHGANWEGFLTQQLLYGDDARNLRYIPLLFEGASEEDVPLVLRSTRSYHLPNDYDDLFRRLSDQHAVRPAPVGHLRQLAPIPVMVDQELDELRNERRTMALAGKDTATIDQRILVRRRQIRDTDDIGPGRRLYSNRFELAECIGSGGFGTVWKAFDNEMNIVVAVKILHSQYRHDITRKERFLRGACRMGKLRHPGIVPVIMAKGEQQGVTYFVMDYVVGGDLRKRVCEGSWKQEQTLPTLLKIGDALDHAHQHGLVHRDVKPANILLDANSNPLLTDFDLVQAQDTTGGTREGTGLGSLMFAAPESLENANAVDQRADIYSLGMVGAFMLFRRDLPLEVVRSSTHFIERLECPDPVRRVLLRACDWKVQERYVTVSEFLAALRMAEAGALDVTRSDTSSSHGAGVSPSSDNLGSRLEAHRCGITIVSKLPALNGALRRTSDAAEHGRVLCHFLNSEGLTGDSASIVRISDRHTFRTLEDSATPSLFPLSNQILEKVWCRRQPVCQLLSSDDRSGGTLGSDNILQDCPHLTAYGSSVPAKAHEPPCASCRSNLPTDSPFGRVVLMLPLQSEVQFIDTLRVELSNEHWDSDRCAAIALMADAYQQARLMSEARMADQQRSAVNRELEIAREIHQSCVPQEARFHSVSHSLQAVVGFEPCWWVGGDYADAIALPDGRVLLTIADVCGKGVQAALVAVVLRNLLHLVSELCALSELMERMNRHLCRHLPDHAFVTALMIAVNLDTGDLEVVSTGHPPALVANTSGRVWALDVGRNVGLGVTDTKIVSGRGHLEPDQILLLYTDGLTEALDKDRVPLGMEQLARMLSLVVSEKATSNLDAMKIALLLALREYSGPYLAHDDCTFMLARRQASKSSIVL